MSTQERLGFFVAMGGQVVEDDNGAGDQLWDQHFCTYAANAGPSIAPLIETIQNSVPWRVDYAMGSGV